MGIKQRSGWNSNIDQNSLTFSATYGSHSKNYRLDILYESSSRNKSGIEERVTFVLEEKEISRIPEGPSIRKIKGNKQIYKTSFNVNREGDHISTEIGPYGNKKTEVIRNFLLSSNAVLGDYLGKGKEIDAIKYIIRELRENSSTLDERNN